MTEDMSQVSDGYHTFAELYRYRALYNAAAFNAWATAGINDVHKSWRHHDGEECFGGGWFIVSATLPTGQISNHYPAESWWSFKIPVRDRGAEWDGHTPEEAARRLDAYNHLTGTKYIASFLVEPKPRVEWAVQSRYPGDRWITYEFDDYETAYAFVSNRARIDERRLVHRYVTDWEPAEEES